MTKIAEMTDQELTRLIDERIERKLNELLDDPDRDLQLREPLRRRLVAQMKDVAAGERGVPLGDVMAEFDAS